MNHRKRIEALNEKARAIEGLAQNETRSIEALEDGTALKMPVGCTTVFDTGWETNPRATSPVGNCQSSARDYLGCAGDCWWPAQNPDGLTNSPDFDVVCPNIARDWRAL